MLKSKSEPNETRKQKHYLKKVFLVKIFQTLCFQKITKGIFLKTPFLSKVRNDSKKIESKEKESNR